MEWNQRTGVERGLGGRCGGVCTITVGIAPPASLYRIALRLINA
jgi:hypothetical protein